MQNAEVESTPRALVERLRKATNAHDLEALVACFAPGYENITPTHPERGFTGSAQVRKNWEQILRFVPDITTKVLRSSVEGDTVWSEWEHRGTRANGSPHVMCGVVIFGVKDGLFTWARFYLEPVQEGGGGVDHAIARQMSPGGGS